MLRYQTTLSGHTNTVSALEIDRRFYAQLFSCGYDYTVRVWHCGSFTSRISDSIGNVVLGSQGSISTPGNGLYSGSGAGNLSQCEHTFQSHKKRVLALRHLPYCGILASGGADNSLNLYNIDRKELAFSFRKMHRGAVYSIVSLDRESADSTKIVTARGDRKIRIIDLKKKGIF